MHVPDKLAESSKIKRIRWTEMENEEFRKAFEENIRNKKMPSGTVLAELARRLPGRTVPQLRTKIHNIISGKLKRF